MDYEWVTIHSDILYSDSFLAKVLQEDYSRTDCPALDHFKNILRALTNALYIEVAFNSRIAEAYLNYLVDNEFIKYFEGAISDYDNYSWLRDHYLQKTKALYMEHIRKNEDKITKVTKPSNADDKKYYYMLTFTVAPNKVPQITKWHIDTIESYIKDIVNRSFIYDKSEFIWRQEKHKNGRPHWHVGVSSNVHIDKSRFIVYSNKFGRVDVKLSKSGNYGQIVKYVTKEDML